MFASFRSHKQSITRAVDHARSRAPEPSGEGASFAITICWSALDAF